MRNKAHQNGHSADKVLSSHQRTRRDHEGISHAGMPVTQEPSLHQKRFVQDLLHLNSIMEW